MNTREIVTIRSPNEINEECVKFTIDDISKPFIFHGIAKKGQEYTFSSWMMSEEELELTAAGMKFLVNSDWKRNRVSFKADSEDLKIYFNQPGTYYFYESQLEEGNTMTGWTLAPEDIATITILNSSIEASASEINLSVSGVKSSVDALEGRVENTEASIELKVNTDTLISEINASADIIALNGNRFVVNSDNLQISEDGTITAKNGDFTGILNSKTGNIGGWNINEFNISSSNDGDMYTEDGLKIASLNLGYLEFSRAYTREDISFRTNTFLDGSGVKIISVLDAAGSEQNIELSAMGFLFESDNGDEVVRSTIINENSYSIIRDAMIVNGGFYKAYVDAEGMDLKSIDNNTGENTTKISSYEINTTGTIKANNMFVNDKSVSLEGHTHNRLYNSALDEYISFVKDGDAGYFRPNNGDLVRCGSGARPWYKVYTNRLDVLASKPVFSYIGSDGQGAAVSNTANMFVGATGIVSRTTNTSSRTIKHDIDELKNNDIKAELLYKLPIHQAKYNADVLSSEDKRYLKDLPMFIIEEMNEIYPAAVDKPSDNVREWSWNPQYLIPPMLKLIQNHKNVLTQISMQVDEESIKNESKIDDLYDLVMNMYNMLLEQQIMIQAMAQ